jgi:hypothetical protein
LSSMCISFFTADNPALVNFVVTGQNLWRDIKVSAQLETPIMLQSVLSNSTLQDAIWKDQENNVF